MADLREDIPPDPAVIEQADHLQTLNEIGRAVSATLDLDTLYETIYQQVGRVMDTTHFFIALDEPRRNAVVVPYLREGGILYRDEVFPAGDSVTWLVIQRGTPLLFDDDDEYARYAESNGLTVGVVGSEETQAKIWVPLTTGERTIGALTVQSARSTAYTADDVAALSVIASQAAVAIINAELYKQSQNRVHELQAIQTIIYKIAPLHEIPAIAAVIDAELNRLIDYHSCRLFVLDQEHQVLLPIKYGSDQVDYRLRLGEGLAGWIALHGRPVIVDNTLADDRVTHIPGTPHREESMMGVPLIYEGQVQGVITLSRLGTNQFDENSLRLLEIVAGQAALAFDRARLYAALRTEAITDPLTELHNRRYLDARLNEERARAHRTHAPLAVLMLDIDRFKRINDRHGHDAGDRVLQVLANLIRGAVRQEDVVARYGGEEFCVLVPNLPADEAERVAERLRQAIEDQILPPEAGEERVTVSVGVAHLDKEDAETEIFRRADLAMYTAKHAGGNKVVVSEGDGFRIGR